MATTPLRQRLGVLANAAATAASTAVITAAAAIVGALVAREFGRTDETDGFFAAYGVYVVLVLAATTLRVVVLPPLVRAHARGQLGGELGGYSVALALLCGPMLAVALLRPEWPAALLTATPRAGDTAAAALVWLLPAAVAQIYAGLAASALAAHDDYLVPAAGFALGAVAGLGLILVRLDTGIQSLAEGIALNGAVSVAVPVVTLWLRGSLRRAAGGTPRVRARLAEFARGVGLPLAVQALYLIGLRSAGQLGTGEQTSFSYAYLIASSVVAVTASSFSLVSSAPLTRRGLSDELTARHVSSMVWLSAAPIAAVAAVFAVVGGPLLHAALGPEFAGDVGAATGRLVLVLAPWMLASAALSIVFPLLFVAGRDRLLPALAVAAVFAHVPVDAAGRELGGLSGVGLALALTTAAATAALLFQLSRGAPAAVGRRLLRPRLREAWAYARALR